MDLALTEAVKAKFVALIRCSTNACDAAGRGDPMGPLLWTCSSAARLATELTASGHPVSERTVNRLLHELGHSLQANRKTLEGKQHADATRSSNTSTDGCARLSACGSR